MKFKSLIKKTSNWLTATPQRSLDQAYKAALKIKEIEDNHFGSKKVSGENADYGDSVISYFTTEVNGYLKKINVGLGVFKTSRLFLNISNLQEFPQDIKNERELQKNATTVAIIFDKLEFIDNVTSKYQSRDTQQIDNGSLALTKPSLNGQETRQLNGEAQTEILGKNSNNIYQSSAEQNNDSRLESASQKTGVLPRSFINTLNRN